MSNRKSLWLTKLHDSEIYISHSITKILHNDVHLSLMGLRQIYTRQIIHAVYVRKTILDTLKMLSLDSTSH